MGRQNGFAWLAVAGASLTLASGAWADSSARPLRGTFTGSGFDFHGQFAHWGSFTAHIERLEPTQSGTLLEEWTATTANGDTLHVTGESSITGVNPDTGFLLFGGTRTIVGGTGRFAGATGTYHAAGETAPDFSTYHGDVSGVIGY
jgi:hypothetical protein